jgi:hypothetical protein
LRERMKPLWRYANEYEEGRKKEGVEEAICRCGHAWSHHHRGHSCVAFADAAKLRYCKCEEFSEAKRTAKHA